MFFVIDDEVADDGLTSLQQLAEILDERRAQLDLQLAEVSEECPAHEHGDDLAGLGFVACQRYMTEVAAQLGVPRTQALAMGPRTVSGDTVACLVNAAANAWKHEAEWREPLQEQQRRTAERLASNLPDNGWDYKYVNALHAITGDSRFETVAHLLAQWRDDLRRLAP